MHGTIDSPLYALLKGDEKMTYEQIIREIAYYVVKTFGEQDREWACTGVVHYRYKLLGYNFCFEVVPKAFTCEDRRNTYIPKGVYHIMSYKL
jgi:hypothetical protein